MLHTLKRLLQNAQLQQIRTTTNQAEVIKRSNMTGREKGQSLTGMNKFKCFSLLVLSIALIDGATVHPSAYAAPSDAVLMAENNTLSQTDVDQVIAFYEWAFAAKFTIAQRNEYQSILATNFRENPAATKKSIDAVISNYAQALTKSEAQQSRIRQAFSQDFVEQLRNLPADAEAKLLLSVYNSAHSETASNTSSSASEGAGEMSSIVGKWVWAHTGNSAYSTSGVHLGSNGSRFTFQFLPNGTVEYTGIMNVMSGGCNQQIFQSRTGEVHLSGSTMTISWSPSRFTRDFSCDSANNYTKTLPAENQTYQVRFKDDLGQKQLCLTEKDETCFSPAS